MFLRACCIAFEIATGTSRALPYPKPTRPAPSPTTVSAVKPNCRPPLTTFAVRLTATSFSIRSSPDWDLSTRAIAYSSESELEAGFARGLGERLHAPVVTETRPVEGHGLDARGLGTLGDGAADGLRRRRIASALQVLGDRFLDGRRSREHLGAVRRRDLGVDVPRRAVHRQARRAGLADVGAGAGRAPQAPVFFRELHGLTSSCLPSSRSFRRRSARPCPCRAPAGGSRGSPPRPGRPCGGPCPSR